MRWQRVARLLIALAAVVFAVVVALGFRRRGVEPTNAAPARADLGAVVEVTGGRVGRFKFSREDVHVDCTKQFVYQDGSTKLVGVTIATDDRSNERSFTVKANEGTVGQDEAMMVLTGAVRLDSSDGIVVRAEHASYATKDGVVEATGPVEFSRGKMSGSGIGMKYDTTVDRLTILSAAKVRVAPDEHGNGKVEIAADTANFERRDHMIQFDGTVNLQRAGQIVDADQAVVHLTADEKEIETMDLRGHSRIAMARSVPGGLQSLSSGDMNLKYGVDGQTLEHATLVDNAAIVLTGDTGSSGRQIAAKTIDLALAPDGTTPVALVAREAVQLLLPAEGDLPTRTVRAASMRAEGPPDRGLTHAVFDGSAEYTERAAGLNRTATAGLLDATLKPAMAGLENARFSHAVRFVDGDMTATAAAAQYDLDKGVLYLSGSEPGALKPHVVNDKITVDAIKLDVTLVGPQVVAKGIVKSVLRPSKGDAGASGPSDTHFPSMFKDDRPVNVTADALDYSGTTNKAAYTGNAQLWQEETSVKGKSIVLDDKTGDMIGAGGVATVTVRDDVDADKKPRRVRTIATAPDFRYDDAERRATYTGGAHMVSPSGDITATKIELYLESTGDQLDHVEAYQNVTLRDTGHTTTGARLTYTTADDRYLVTGAPVKMLDTCGRATTGKTLTYLKATETAIMDGNEQTRTQSTGNGPCP